MLEIEQISLKTYQLYASVKYGLVKEFMIKIVKILEKSTFLNLTFFTILFFIPIYAEISIVLLLPLFLVGIYLKKTWKSIYLIALFIFFSAIYFLNLYHIDIKKLFIFFFPISLSYYFTKFLVFANKNTIKIIFIISFCTTFILSLSNFFIPLKEFKWNYDESKIKIETFNTELYIKAISNNSWIDMNLGYLRNGKYIFVFDVRTKNHFTINIEIFKSNLNSNPIIKNKCYISSIFKKCEIIFEINERGNYIILFGRNDSFTYKNSPFILRNLSFNAIYYHNIIDFAVFSQRIKLFSFNENAFGASIAIFGILALIFMRSCKFYVICTFLSTILLIWSGSRNALLAYVLAYVFLALGKFLVPKLNWGRFLLLGYALVCVVLLISGFAFFRNSATETNSSQLTRVITPSYDLSVRGRVQLWRLTTQIWLESPRSFLFGVGNLADALRSNLDARALANGLSKENITHAHNLWVQTAGETGLLGLLCLCLGWGLAIHRAWKNRDWGALSIFLCVFVINTFDYLFYYAPVQLVFWMAVVGFQKPSNAVESPKALPASA